MSRATRFLALAIPLAIVYLLALLGVLPVPLISSAHASLLLPVVRFPHTPPSKASTDAQEPNPLRRSRGGSSFLLVATR